MPDLYEYPLYPMSFIAMCVVEKIDKLEKLKLKNYIRVLVVGEDGEVKSLKRFNFSIFPTKGKPFLTVILA